MASKVTGPIDPESKFWDHLIKHAERNARTLHTEASMDYMARFTAGGFIERFPDLDVPVEVAQ